jgi:hypothetical protein
MLLALAASAALPAGAPRTAPGLLAAAAADSASARDSADEETCRELMDRVRASDCVRPVARFLEGASVKVGVALYSGQLELTRNDSVKAYLLGILSPAPYYGFSFSPAWFGASRFGWELSFLYTNAVAVNQRFARADNDYRDVGTYASMTFVSFSPSAFMALGARDGSPDTYVRLGVGVGAGWAAVRGTAYFTEDSSGANHGCWDAGEALLAGKNDAGAYRDACELHTYRHASLGISVRGFLDARWRFLYFAWETETVKITSGRTGYAPIELALKLAWIHDL